LTNRRSPERNRVSLLKNPWGPGSAMLPLRPETQNARPAIVKIPPRG
jgi:hypothetical protein